MSIFDKLIGAVRGSPQEPEMKLARCREIASVYGAILEKGPVPGTVADESELPYPKKTIKQALVTLLKSTRDPQMRGNLSAAYMCLSDWQAGVGRYRVGFDISRISQSDDTISIAERVAATEESAKLWLAKSELEQQSLISELREMGFW